MLDNELEKNDAKVDPASDQKVDTHTSDSKNRKLLNTSNRKFQQKLLSNRTLPIITTTIYPRILGRVSTCTPHALTTTTTKEIITDTACSSSRTLRTPEHVSRTGRNSTKPCDRNVVVRSPRDNGPVLIEGIIVPPTVGNGGILDIIKKSPPTSQSVRKNVQNFNASVDRNLTNDR